MERNIKLVQIAYPLRNLSFWSGIWVLFYLLFTDYKGIGLIEIVEIFIVFALEIPTGAFADLFGKKRTLNIAFFFLLIGQFVMASANGLYLLMFSVALLGFGSVLYSGTAEAFLYDSLKTLGRENEFDTIYSKVQRNNLLFLAVASIIGGFLFSIDPRMPFILTGFVRIILFIISFFFIEPPIDSEKFNFKNYINQTQQGFKQLFKAINPLQTIYILIFAGSLITIFSWIIDNALAVEIGYDGEAMGVLFAILPFVSAIGSWLYPKLKTKFKVNNLLSITLFLFILISIVSPIAGIVLGTLILVSRNFLYPIFDIITSDTLNKSVDSKYRATTLSTFSMLKSLPYAFTAYLIGDLIDNYQASNVSMYVSLILVAILFLILLTAKLRKWKTN